MKKVCITYHMEKKTGSHVDETAETCITLPMEDSVADSLLRYGNDSMEMLDIQTPGLAAFGGASHILPILRNLAALQGYCFTEAVHFQDATDGVTSVTPLPDNHYARFVVLYDENSDAACRSEIEFFHSKEKAQEYMKDCFHACGRGDEPYWNSDDDFVSIDEDSICVQDGIDSYKWRIETIKAYDAE